MGVGTVRKSMAAVKTWVERCGTSRKIFAVAAALAAALPAQARSLLYYYDFEDVSGDSLVYTGINRGSGTVELTGKFNSGSKIGYTGAGAFGSSGAFKAVSSQNSLWLGNGSASLGCGTEKGFTISFWMKTMSSHSAWTNPFGFRLAGTDYRIEYTGTADGTFEVYSSAGKSMLTVEDGGGTRVVDAETGVWKHYAFVFRPNCGTTAGLGTCSVYVDGEYKAAMTVAAAGNLQQLYIGTWVRGDGNKDRKNGGSNSEIDEVAVYDYPATAENVKWLSRNKPAPGVVAMRAMPVMWPFDESSDNGTHRYNTSWTYGLWPGNAGSGTDGVYRWKGRYWTQYTSPGAVGTSKCFALRENTVADSETFRVDGASATEGLGANLLDGASLSFWIKAPANLGRNWQKILSFQIGSSKAARFEWQTNDPAIMLFGTPTNSDGALALKPGEWTHVCMNWNRGKSAFEFYVDGIKQTVTWVLANPTSADVFKSFAVGIVAVYWGNNNGVSPSGVYVDEPAIFNHSLSDGQITWLAAHIPEVTPLDTTNLVRSVSADATWAADGGASWTARRWDDEGKAWADTELALRYPTLEDCDVESSVSFSADATLTVDTVVTGKKISFLKSGGAATVSPALAFADGARFDPSVLAIDDGMELRLPLYREISGTVSFGAGSKIVLDVSNYDGEMKAFSFGGIELPEGETDILSRFGVTDGRFSLELSQDGKTVYARLDGHAYTATWAGAAGGSIADPANWSCVDGYGRTLDGALPCKYTRVIAGGTLSVPAGAAIPWEFLRFEAGSVSLAQDCDWSAFGGLCVQSGATVDLAGRRLAAAVAEGRTLELGSFNVDGGVLAVSGAGALANRAAATIAAGTLEVAVPLDMAAALTVENYTALYDGSDNSGTAALNVTGTFTPGGSGYYGCTMQSGSTIDLNGLSGAWQPAGVAFAAGTIAIGVSRRQDLGQIAVSEDPYILKWTSSTPMPSNVEFVPDAAAANRGYTFETDAVGVKVKPQPGFIIHIAEGGSVTVPGAWTLEKMGEPFWTDDVPEWLVGAGANGLPRWQSWLLGLEPADASSVVLCRAVETQPGDGTFAIGANVDVQAGSGAEVTAYLDTSADGKTWAEKVASQALSDGGTVSFSRTLASGERGFYRIRLAVQ